MDYLYQKIPKDLVNIVEEYAKDRTNYDKVMIEFFLLISRNWSYIDSNWCGPSSNVIHMIKYEQQRKNDDWYINNKKLKKPHGKRPPTIKDIDYKYRLRFGRKIRFKRL